jgi:hypothetical protein
MDDPSDVNMAAESGGCSGWDDRHTSTEIATDKKNKYPFILISPLWH